MKPIKLGTLLWLLLWLLPAQAATPSTDVNYTYHSVFIYNFLKYIEWPTSAQSGSEIIIGVIGSPEASEALQKMMTGKTVNGSKITVKSFASAAAITSCQVLFLPQSSSEQLEVALAKTKDKSILLITEKPGLSTKGSHLNFVLKDNKIAFEANREQLKQAGLKVSSDLLKLAILI